MTTRNRAAGQRRRAFSLQVTENGLAALEEMGTEVLKVSATLNAALDVDSILLADRQLRQAAHAVEDELREMDRAQGRPDESEG